MSRIALSYWSALVSVGQFIDILNYFLDSCIAIMCFVVDVDTSISNGVDLLIPYHILHIIAP